MNSHHYPRLIVTVSLLMMTVQVTAEEPRSAATPDRPDPNSPQVESPDKNLLLPQVSRNPVTGQIEIAPGSGTRTWTLSPREQNMLSRSDEGLQPTILANGAVALNLRGRFQSLGTAASDPGNNRLKMSCSIGDVAPVPEDQTEDQY